MKCKILHETTGRLRVHLCCGRMTVSQADVLEYYLRAQDGVQAVKVYDRTQDAVVLYEAERGNIIRALAQFSFAKAEAMELVPEHTSRALILISIKNIFYPLALSNAHDGMTRKVVDCLAETVYHLFQCSKYLIAKSSGS